ncbi:hypothetical protein pb186bvf_006357 [Paramecium bursaria]
MSNQDLSELPALKVNVPSFLVKTYEILENKGLSDIISWNNEGNAFLVYNTNELASKVLANYFKHKNYPSFLRQLNMYNFKKSKNQYGQSEFRHKWFRRGLKSMLQYIRRRNQEEAEVKVETKEKDLELDSYKRDHETMKDMLKSLVYSQQNMQRELSASLEQNSVVQRQNQQMQQQFNNFQQQNQRKFDSLSMLIAKVVSGSDQLQSQLGDILKLLFCGEEQQPMIENQKSEYSYMVPQQEYSNMGSPYPYFVQNSPIHLLFQNQKNFYEYHFDPSLFFGMNKYRPPQQQLALPPIPYPFQQSNNYSLQSSQQGSPYRVSNCQHSSTTDSKSMEKDIMQQFNLYPNINL